MSIVTGSFSQDWRFNPITETLNAETITGESQTCAVLPGTGGLYGFQLTEVPLQESPTSVTVTRDSDSQVFTEVSTDPGTNEFFVDYKYKTALIILNSSEDTEDFTISYKGTGAANSVRNNQKTIIQAAYPVGTIIPYDSQHSLTPALTSGVWVECNGQLISDAESPYNGTRIRNLNGATLSSIGCNVEDNINKVLQLNIGNAWAVNIGDTVTITGASVPNAIIRDVSGVNHQIYIGDSTSWDIVTEKYSPTTSDLTGATSVVIVGRRRFIQGYDGSGKQSDVNQFQGFNMNVFRNTDNTTGSTFGTPTLSDQNNDGTFATGDLNNIGKASGYLSDGTNGTPRFGANTKPDLVAMKYIIRIK